MHVTTVQVAISYKKMTRGVTCVGPWSLHHSKVGPRPVKTAVCVMAVLVARGEDRAGWLLASPGAAVCLGGLKTSHLLVHFGATELAL